MSASATLKAQGWDGSAWVDLATYTASPAIVSNVQTFAFTNTTAYSKYRLYEAGTSGVAIGTNAIQEVRLDIPTSYISSLHAKSSCTADADADGVYNHLDLDSDGDGCSDLKEASVAPLTDQFTPSTTNNSGGSYGITDPTGSQLNPNGTDTNNDGLNDSVDADLNHITNYTSTYANYALNSNVSLCSSGDSDGDGIADIIDLDDDNDGILDTVESCAPTKTGAWTNTAGVFSTTTTGGLGVSVSSQSLSGSTNFVYVGNDTMNATNFWSNPTVAGAASLNFTTYWDTTPETPNYSDIDLPTDDKGTIAVTLTFNQPINNFTLNVDRLGGLASYLSNTSLWQLQNSGISMYKLSGNDQLIVTKNAFYRAYDVDLGLGTISSEADFTTGTAAGSIQLSSPTAFTSVTFNVTGAGAEGIGADGLEFVIEGCGTVDTDNDGIPNYLDLDSDNDGCLDALEGDENVTTSDLVSAGGSLSVGTGSTASNQNLGNTVDAYGVPIIVNSGGAADIGGDEGQGLGGSINALVNSCACYNVASSGSGADTKHGITLLRRAGDHDRDQNSTNDWPMVRKSAYTVLESNTKGFVVTRMANPETTIGSNAMEGMIVYDTDDQCLKIYDGTVWSCFTAPACP